MGRNRGPEPAPPRGLERYATGDASWGKEGSSRQLSMAVEDSGPRPAPRPQLPRSASGQRPARRKAGRTEGARSARRPGLGRSHGGPEGGRRTPRRGQGGGGRLGAGGIGAGGAAWIGRAPPRDRPLIGRGAGGGVGCGGCRAGRGPVLVRRLRDCSAPSAWRAPRFPCWGRRAGDARGAREPWSALGTSSAAAMGAPAAGSGPGAAEPAARAARAPGGCSRASGSSTSNRSRSARAPWRCTTPSRSSRTASPSTARSSSSARTTSSANTPSASLSGHILSGAGPGRAGGGCPRARHRDPAPGPASAPRRVWEGRLGRDRAGRVRRPVAIFPGPGGGCDLGRGTPGGLGVEGAGRRGPSPPAAGACVCARVRSRRRRRRQERGGRWAEPPAPGHVPSLPGRDAERTASLEGTEAEPSL